MVIDEKTIALAGAMNRLKNDSDPENAAGIARLVEVFGSMTQEERNATSAALKNIADKITSPGTFLPRLIAHHIKIPVQSNEQGAQVQKALFALGFGFDGYGTLLKNVELGTGNLIGIHASPKGRIGITFPRERDWFAKCSDILVPPELVLESKSLEELNAHIEFCIQESQDNTSAPQPMRG